MNYRAFGRKIIIKLMQFRLRNVISFSKNMLENILTWFGFSSKNDNKRSLNYSMFVKRLKLVITFSIVFFIFAIIILPILSSSGSVFKFDFESEFIDGEDAPKVQIAKPRFHGFDKKNQPYNITAEIAVKEDEETVRLKSIKGDLSMKGGKWLSAMSEEGYYKTKEKILLLEKSVNIFTDQGYEIFTESALIDIEANKTLGDKEVLIHGPIGTLRADNFVVENAKSKITMEGNIRLRAIPR